MTRITRISNFIYSSSFRLSVSMLAQHSVFVDGVYLTNQFNSAFKRLFKIHFILNNLQKKVHDTLPSSAPMTQHIFSCIVAAKLALN